MKQNRVIVQY